MEYDLNIQQKFVQHLKDHTRTLRKYHTLMEDNVLSTSDKEDLISTVHLISGLCLTFNLSGVGDTARFVEVRLRGFFEKEPTEEYIQNLNLLKNLIHSCDEGADDTLLKIKESENSFLINETEVLISEVSYHVLVVDDDPILRVLAKRGLELAGYKVSTANDGIFAADVALNIKPDLILMDSSMPKMDGMEAAEFIKTETQTKHIPIFLLTAHEISQFDESLKCEFIDECLQKPFDLEKIVNLINKYKKN